MRKLLLLIATLSLAALAFAATSEKTDRAGNDFYNQVLSVQVHHYEAVNDAVSPASDIAEPQSASSELPASMAGNEAAQGGDWYNQKVGIEAEQNRRTKNAELNTF